MRRADRLPTVLVPHQLRPQPSDRALALVTRHRARWVIAGASVIAFLALTLGISLYLSTPHQPLSWKSLWPRAKAPQVKASAVTNEPGSVDLQVQRGKSTQAFRFRKNGEAWSIQDVTTKGKPSPKTALPSHEPKPENPPPPLPPGS